MIRQKHDERSKRPARTLVPQVAENPQLSSSVADALDAAEKARHRAFMLWAMYLDRQFGSWNGQPSLSSVLNRDGSRSRPRRDVVDELKGELVVAASLARQKAEAILRGPAEVVTTPELPAVFE